LYSLGVVGYHMLSGDTPFKAANTPAMLVKHVSERPRPVRDRRPEVPAYLAVAIDRALAKRADDRWSDAAELRDALDGGPIAPPPRNRKMSAPAVSAPLPPVPVMSAPLAYPVANPQIPAPFPPPPPGLNRRELREWYRAQRRLAMAQLRGTGVVINNRAPFGKF